MTLRTTFDCLPMCDELPAEGQVQRWRCISSSRQTAVRLWHCRHRSGGVARSVEGEAQGGSAQGAVPGEGA